MVNAPITFPKVNMSPRHHFYSHSQPPILCPLTYSTTLPSHPDTTQDCQNRDSPMTPFYPIPARPLPQRRLSGTILIRIPHTIRFSVQLKRTATLVSIAQIQSGILRLITRRRHVQIIPTSTPSPTTRLHVHISPSCHVIIPV